MSDIAIRIAKAIERDLNDRRDLNLDEFDDDIQKEIRDRWLVLIANELQHREPHIPDYAANRIRLEAAIESVEEVRDDIHLASHRVDEGYCEAILVLLRKLSDSQVSS